ncbi:MAG: SusC/RagA family TonB-linked outer membrane protein [Muribaculaceae bacterium]
MKRLMLILACAVLSIGVMSAQKRVTGVVTDTEGSPIVGASVLVDGTRIGTSTDMDGKFSISNIPSGAKRVIVSYVGMNSRAYDIAEGLKVVLESNTELLDEVVVTAMGVKKSRKALGYAVDDLKAEELNTNGTTSIANAVQGKLTGVEIHQSSGAPGASAVIQIRGARSFDGDNTPLYVIDGMPITSTPDFDTSSSVTGADYANRSIDINPEDIESINVLKGQAASALYGIRASNGVIVITTKRGSKIKGKPTVTVSTNLSAERVTRKFERQTVYAQGSNGRTYNPTTSFSWGPKISELPNDPNYGGNVQNAYTANGLHQGEYYNPKRALAGLSGWETPQVYDNYGDFFGTGFTENTSANIAQTLDNVTYSFSVNNSYQEGVIPSTGMNRWGARGLVDWSINSEWKTGFSANYSSSKINSAPGANSGIVNVVYSCPAEYNLKGIPTHVPGNPNQQVLFRSTSFNNPYWWAENDEYLQHTNRTFGNAYLEYSPRLSNEKAHLTIREQAGVDLWTSNYRDKAAVGSAANSSGEISNYGVQNNVFNNLLTANFTTKFGDDDQWDIDVVLGNEINHQNNRTWSYYGSNFNFPGFDNIGNATSYTSSEYESQDRTVGFFGSLSLSWANQIYLTVTGRNDYVSTMPRNNRSFFYPSVSLGWIFTELSALKNNKVLTYGKLRASFAQVGQAGRYYNNFAYVPSYGGGFYLYTPVTYPLPSGISSYAPYYVLFDPNLKPQNTSNFEVGTDLSFFDNRLSVEYTYSYQNIKDQIFSVPIDGATGYQYKMTNAGKMQTSSHELSVNGEILKGKDYSLNLGVNFTKINNKVKELAPGVESIFLGGFVEPQVRAQAGCTYPNLYGTGIKRDENGNMLLLGGMPQATGDSQNLGNCSPDFTMGFNLGGSYKRVSVSTTWSWQNGGKIYHGSNLVMNYFGVTKESLPYHEGTMVAEGIDEATGQKNTVEVSSMAYFMALNDITEAGIYDASYLKLRDVTLTYQLPKIGMFDISVFGFARNVLIWAKMPNFDPEASQGNNNMSGYFERFSVPATSSFGGGLKVTF